jgi:hypothetical protein
MSRPRSTYLGWFAVCWALAPDCSISIGSRQPLLRTWRSPENFTIRASEMERWLEVLPHSGR